MDLSCSPLIAHIMEICNAAGVSEVVRIIPDPTPDIGLQIMSFFHYRNDVYIRTVASAAEAIDRDPRARTGLIAGWRVLSHLVRTMRPLLPRCDV